MCHSLMPPWDLLVKIWNAIICVGRCLYACMEFCNQSGLISVCKQVREGLHDTGKYRQQIQDLHFCQPTSFSETPQTICSCVQATLSIPCCGIVYILDGENVANSDKTSVPLSCCFWRPAFVIRPVNWTMATLAFCGTPSEMAD